MFLRDIAIYADASIVDRFPSRFVEWFHRESCSITELYVALLGRSVATPDTVKANFEFIEDEDRVATSRQLLNVVDVRWPFRFAEYAESDAAGKKTMVLEALHAALVWLAEARGWDRDALEHCRTQALARNLTPEGWSKRSWSDPRRTFRAKIGFRFELRSVEFYVGVFDKHGQELGRQPLGAVVPEMGVTIPILKGDGEWDASNVFRLTLGEDGFSLPKTWQADLSDLIT